MPSGAVLVQIVVLLVVLLAASAALTLSVRARRRRTTGAGTPGTPSGPGTGAPLLPAVVANPTKIAHLDGERAWLAQRTAELGWQKPLWLETRIDEPGTAAAREAVAAGARTVIAYGGDGTVRGVAAGLAGSAASLGILPMGTGNLLARNLGLPLANLDLAVDIALGGRERLIDLGRVEIDVSGEDEAPAQDAFLVMAGLGFDAEVMASVQPELKEKVGWFAYVLAGARRLRGRTTAVTLRFDDGEPLRRRVRSVVVGNCGELTAGAVLMPLAEVDDGWLDVAVVAPRRMLQWGAVFVPVMSRGLLPRRFAPREPIRRPRALDRWEPVMEHFRCRSLEIRAEKPMPVQLDGDPAGEARVLRAQVAHQGLTVRVP